MLLKAYGVKNQNLNIFPTEGQKKLYVPVLDVLINKNLKDKNSNKALKEMLVYVDFFTLTVQDIMFLYVVKSSIENDSDTFDIFDWWARTSL